MIIFFSLLVIASALNGVETRDCEVDELFVKELWERRAEEWDLHIARRNERDSIRLYQTDPVLLEFFKESQGKVILDAGCGNGYFSTVLAQRGARVIGVDVSEKMIELAKSHALADGLKIDYRVDSVTELSSLKDRSIDRIVSNYVLMDLPNLEAAIQQFHRVLKKRGDAVLVISHPCFPRKYRKNSSAHKVCIEWEKSYLEDHIIQSPPCPGFSEEFVAFHRPISKYWKVFKESGFEVTEILEPTVSGREEEMNSDVNERLAPYPRSIIFVIRKQ